MKAEINLVASFIVKLAISGPKPVRASHQQRLRFLEELMNLLHQRMPGHRYLQQPTRGRGYRILRFDQFTGPDPLVVEAAKRADFPHGPLTWPLEMSLWIDPGQVTAKMGEDGSIFPVTVDDVKWPYIHTPWGRSE